jgi:MgtC family
MSTIWQEVWRGLQADFSDLPGIAEVTQVVVRLLLAALLGGLLGLQRELVGKAAGLRTHMLVALGSAFFVLIPSQAGMPLVDLSRVLQVVITGIGFLGAGAILSIGNLKAFSLHSLCRPPPPAATPCSRHMRRPSALRPPRRSGPQQGVARSGQAARHGLG